MTRLPRLFALTLIAMLVAAGSNLFTPQRALAVAGNPLLPLRATTWKVVTSNWFYGLTMGTDDIMREAIVCPAGSPRAGTVNPQILNGIVFDSTTKLNGQWVFKYITQINWTPCRDQQFNGSGTLFLSVDGSRLQLFNGSGQLSGTWTRDGDNGLLGHYVAWQMLQNANISVTSSTGYVGPDRTRVGTSLAQVRRMTIAGMIDFKMRCLCEVVVTGGTETSSHSSAVPGHHSGHKLDIQSRLGSGADSPATLFIRNSGQFSAPTVLSNGWIQRTDNQKPSNVYTREYPNQANDHWDILFLQQ